MTGDGIVADVRTFFRKVAKGTGLLGLLLFANFLCLTCCAGLIMCIIAEA